MQAFSWLHNRLISKPAARSAAGRKPTPRFRPRLEALEGRDVPSTLTVTSPKDHGPGTLRAEIAAAQPNDAIAFSPKLGGTTITLTTGELDITKNLTIRGPGAGQLTVSGGNLSRVFEVGPNATVTLSGVTISNGVGKASAYDSSGTPLNGCGGGILNEGTLTVSGCIVSGNWAMEGGGIYNADGTMLTVSDCTVLGNTAEFDGGGIWNGGTTTVSNCYVVHNIAGAPTDPSLTPYVGGGIYNAGSLTVSKCDFINNQPDAIFGPYVDGGSNTFS